MIMRQSSVIEFENPFGSHDRTHIKTENGDGFHRIHYVFGDTNQTALVYDSDLTESGMTLKEYALEHLHVEI